MDVRRTCLCGTIVELLSQAGTPLTKGLLFQTSDVEGGGKKKKKKKEKKHKKDKKHKKHKKHKKEKSGGAAAGDGQEVQPPEEDGDSRKVRGALLILNHLDCEHSHRCSLAVESGFAGF